MSDQTAPTATINSCKQIVFLWFELWVKNPESENTIFNDAKSVLHVLEFCYHQLVNQKIVMRLEDIPEKIKIELKLEAKRIDPGCDVRKGMRICKAVHLFGWASNQ